VPCNGQQAPFADEFWTQRRIFLIINRPLASRNGASRVTGMTTKQQIVEGLSHHEVFLNPSEQSELVAVIKDIVAKSPLYVPTMPRSGRPLSVRMTNCGPLGWVTCEKLGYRYQASHPETREPWPAIPVQIMRIWQRVAGTVSEPEACLINWYDGSAKLGLHVDRDEDEFAAPVVSISLGDDAWFRVGGLKRRDPTRRILLKSGDVVVMGGPSRLIHHGIDRIVPGTSKLLPMPGRYNLTLRRVTPL
jgi:alkylated DNA repair protein (DNA oxidative demethylase)